MSGYAGLAAAMLALGAVRTGAPTPTATGAAPSSKARSGRGMNPAKPTKKTFVKSDDLDGTLKAGVGRFTGHVRVTQEDVRITCDTMTVYYEGSIEDGCKRILCDGHVKVTERDRRGSGDHADYNNVNGVLVFTGSPELWDVHSHVKGSKITFYVGTDKYHVDNPDIVTDGADRDASSMAKPAPKPRPKVSAQSGPERK